MSAFFELKGANVWRGEVLALRDVDLELKQGESVAVLGANGAGKSSLLKLMTGELRVEAGRGSVCNLFGEELWNLEELRHRLGLVMPEEVVRFHPREVAFDVVVSAFRGAYGRTGDMRFNAVEKERTARVLEDLGVGGLAGRFFGELSSGEKRRFLIARSLVHVPEVLVLDEPTTALDFSARLGLLARLRSVARGAGSLVMVTHDPGEILPEIGRVVLLKDGEVVADGEKERVLGSAALSELFGMSLRVSWVDGWAVVA